MARRSPCLHGPQMPLKAMKEELFHSTITNLTGSSENNEQNLTCSPSRNRCRILCLNQRVKSHGNENKRQGNTDSNHNRNVMFFNHRPPRLRFHLLPKTSIRVCYHCQPITKPTSHYSCAGKPV